LPKGEAAGRAWGGLLERRIVTWVGSEKGLGEAGDSGSSGKARATGIGGGAGVAGCWEMRFF
jgi:hypothetical protein